MRLLKVSALLLLVAALAGCNEKQEPPVEQEPPLKQGPAPTTEADKLVFERLNERMRRADFNDIELKDAIQFLREVSGANIYVNWAALSQVVTRPRMTVTIHQADIRVGTALALALDSALGAGNATFIVADGLVLVSTHEDAPALAEYLRSRPKGTGSKADRRALKRLNETLRELRFDDIELKEIIQFLRDVSGVSIYVRWNRVNSAGVTKASTVNVHLQEITLHTALTLCLADTATRGKAGYSLADGVLVISTPEDATELARLINTPPAAGKTKADERVLARLNETIREVNFDDIELKDVIQFLRDVSGVSSYVEWSRLNSVGVTKDTTVNVHLQEATLHTALTLCLADAGAEKPIGYIVKDGKIHISTPEGLKKLREGAPEP